MEVYRRFFKIKIFEGFSFVGFGLCMLKQREMKAGVVHV